MPSGQELPSFKILQRQVELLRRRIGEPNHQICTHCENISWERIARSQPRYNGAMVDFPRDFHGDDDITKCGCEICGLLATLVFPGSSIKECTMIALRKSSPLPFLKEAETFLPETNPHFTLVGLRNAAETDFQSLQRGALSILDTSRCCLKSAVQPHFRKETYSTQLLTAVDYQWILAWLHRCHSKHVACQTQSGPGIQGFQVIDCLTMSVVPAPKDCRYVALSYVWGPGTPSLAIEQMPSVVKDSMQVTIALGFQFLWVDRYCIHQGVEQKHQQISQMDKIFGGSEITIIAAAGHDVNHGLPGVNSRPRRSQTRIMVRKVRLGQVFPPIATALEASVWATRGWTFQEGLLSPRRIIFTDNEVAVLCRESFVPEHFRTGSIVYPWTNPSLFERTMPCADEQPMGWELLEKQLEEYNSRTLSWDSDILDASLGMLQSYSIPDPRYPWATPINHVWGLPLMYRPAQKDPDVQQEHLHVPLTWYYVGHGTRRDGFPSWSWTGWRFTHKKFILPDPLYNPTEFSLDSIRIETEGGLRSLMEYVEDQRSSRTSSPIKLPRALHITGIVVPLSFASYRFTAEDRRIPICVLSLVEGFNVIGRVFANTDEMLDLEVTYAGLLLLPLGSSEAKCRHLLILRQREDCYVRFGVVDLKAFDNDLFRGSKPLEKSERQAFHARGSFSFEGGEIRTIILR